MGVCPCIHMHACANLLALCVVARVINITHACAGMWVRAESTIACMCVETWMSKCGPFCASHVWIQVYAHVAVHVHVCACARVSFYSGMWRLNVNLLMCPVIVFFE